ncbi:hypothetical protein ACFVBP_28450 [Nocardioides sp. NPDC057764]|uniref:hypothetical protein n=1 Tax=Nocardioides sp. NPDC057764 TaxID=3346243 RepID=UPI00367268C5
MSTDDFGFDDGLVWIDTPGPDILVDPTGRNPSVRIGTNEKHDLTPEDTRRHAEKLLEAADVAEGRDHSTAGPAGSHQCPYPAAGCTSPDCNISEARKEQRAYERGHRDATDKADAKFNRVAGLAADLQRRGEAEGARLIFAALNGERA